MQRSFIFCTVLNTPSQRLSGLHRMQFSSAVTDLAIFNLSFRLNCEQPPRIFIIDERASNKNRRNSNKAILEKRNADANNFQNQKLSLKA